MAFEKGKSGNPRGREKGSLNKATAAMRERIEQVLDDLDVTLTADLKALRPEQRVELWAKLQEFIRPKLSRTTLTDDGHDPMRGVVTIQVIGAENVRAPTLNERDVLLD